jgi:F-type H+-transporting ATPase subunit b
LTLGALTQFFAQEGQKAPNPILPAKNEIIWGFLSFVVLFVLLVKFAFPAVRRMLEARTDRIRMDLEEAESNKSEAQRILDEYRSQLADARNESNAIIEEARQTAEQLRGDMIARAEQEVRELRERAMADLAAAQERAAADLRTQVRELTLSIAEKLIEKQLDRETNLALIDRFIEQVGSSRT